MRSVFFLRSLCSTLFLASWAIAATGCGSETADDEPNDCETGEELCGCYRNGTCDDGLTCRSKICVEGDDAKNNDDAGEPMSSEAEDSESEGKPGKSEATESDANEETESEAEPATESDAEPATESEAEPATESDVSTDEVPDGTDSAETSSSEPTEELPAQADLTDGSVGSSCGECDAEFTCVPDVPGGYCTTPCGSNAECGAKGECVDNVCYRSCESDAECRPSYACVDVGDVSVCDVDSSSESEAAAGNCTNTCEHYLTCKGVFDAETQQTCEANCTSSGYAAEDLAAFQATDCETAIHMVEGQPNSGGGEGSGGSGVNCDGCQWDGSSCVYLSQYTLISTAGFSCDSSCCPGH